MAEVRERLEARYAGPVRDFVPLLVEKAARERLSRVREGGAGTVGFPASQGEMTPNGE